MKNKKTKKSKNGQGSFFPSLQKHQDNIALLIAYPEFQKEVQKIRSHLNIPHNGSWGSNSIEKWMNSMAEKSDQILESPDYLKHESIIRDKLKRKEITIKQANIQMKLLNDRIPFNYLSRSVDMIMVKFQLPRNYDYFVYNYIVANRVHVPASSFSIGQGVEKYWWRKSGYLPIIVSAQLTDEDLKELKRTVNDWFGKRLPRYQSLKNMEKKIEIAQWHNDPIRQDEATNEFYRMGNKEIAENLLGSKKKNKEVYEASRAVKRLWHTRFGKQ